MSKKITTKDKKILYMLDKNARLSYAQLAKKVQLKQETVRYRINRLLSERIIWKFFTVINLASFGYTIYKVLITLQPKAKQKKETFVRYLMNQKTVSWVGLFDGQFDIGFLLVVKKSEAVFSFLQQLHDVFPDTILDRAICTNLSGEYYSRDYLIKKKRIIKKEWPRYELTFAKELDEIDMEILKLLAKDARMQISEMSKQITLSGDTIARRIKRMEKKKVILTYSLLLATESIGRIRHKLLLFTKNFTQEQEKALRSYCSTNTNILYFLKTLGPWDVEVDIETADVLEFRREKDKLLHKFADIVQTHTSLVLYDIKKYDFLPEELID